MIYLQKDKQHPLIDNGKATECVGCLKNRWYIKMFRIQNILHSLGIYGSMFCVSTPKRIQDENNSDSFTHSRVRKRFLQPKLSLNKILPESW